MLFNTKAKNPRTAFRGFFYSVLLWRLNPQAGSILLPSFTTPVFLLRLRRLSSTFSVNSHLTVLRHTTKAESMLAGPTENQASVHFRKWENPGTQPRFPDGVLSYKKTATNTHKKGRSGYSPFLPFLISFIFFLFFYFLSSEFRQLQLLFQILTQPCLHKLRNFQHLQRFVIPLHHMYIFLNCVIIYSQFCRTDRFSGRKHVRNRKKSPQAAGCTSGRNRSLSGT